MIYYNPRYFSFYRIILSFAIFAIFYPFICISQTIVIFVRNKDSIYIGTDTKFAHIDTETGAITKVDTICKIEKVNKTWLAYSGKIGHTEINFSPIRTIKKVLSKNFTIEQKIDILGDTLRKSIVYFSSKIKEDSAGYFRQEIMKGAVFAALYCDIIGKGTKSFCQYFIVDTLRNGAVRVTPHTIPMVLDSAWFSMGEDGYIKSFMGSNKNFFFTQPIPVAIDTLLNRQIRAAPKTCGLPVCILEIKNGVSKWIKNPSMP